MCPVKIYLSESTRLKEVLQNAQLAKTVGSEIIFDSEAVQEVEEVEDQEPVIPEEQVEEGQKSTLACLTCKVEFLERLEQVAHYKSDFHRYNIKLRLLQQNALTLDEFSNLKDDAMSISGSNSEMSDSATDQHRQRQLSVSLYLSSSESESEKPDEQFNNRLPKFYLKNDQDEIISFYKKLIYSKKCGNIHTEFLNVSVDFLHNAHTQLWCVILFNGNHFAAAVFEGDNVVVHRTFHHYVVRAKRGTAQSANDAQNKGNQAKSAGANLRRNNEASQAKLIQELLTDWQDEYLSKCTLIFLRVPGYKKNLFYGGKNPIFRVKDTRLRSIPFSTRRPTFNEVVRAHKELYSVTVYDKEGAAKMFEKRVNADAKMRRMIEKRNKGSPDYQEKQKQARKRKEKKKQEAYTTPSITQLVKEAEDLVMTEETVSTENLSEFGLDSEVSKKIKKKQQKKKRNQPNTTTNNNDEENVEDPSQKRKSIQEKVKLFENLLEHEKELLILLYTSCKLNDVDGAGELINGRRATTSRSGHDLTQQWDQVGEDRLSAVLSTTIDHQGNTLLHVVSRSGNSQLIRLLLDSGSDPSIRNFDSYLPYNLCPHKTGRNIFRKFRASHPDRFDYDKAEIPPPLTEEVEREIEKRQAEKKKLKKVARKQKEKKKKEEIKAQEEEKQEKERFVALSDREKRLLAIEKRMKTESPQVSASITTNRCMSCGDSLFAKVPFSYFDYQFCSIKCLKAHKNRS